MSMQNFIRIAGFLALAWPACASTLTTLYSPAGTGDGAGPVAGFITVSGKLYGMTAYGGPTGNGSIVEVDPVSSTERMLYNFAGGTDGQQPYGNLLDVGGVLYGTTQYGGANGIGTLFKFDPVTRKETILWNFTGAEGQNPLCTLIDVGGQLFGTTTYGGAHGNGTVFKFSLSGGGASLVYSFGVPGDAVQPAAGLVNFGGTLYGTSVVGGANGLGTIFSVNPVSGAEAVVYSFAGATDAGYPASGLSSAGRLLLGTTEVGGAAGLGTIFSFEPSTGKEKILHSFAGASDGAYPLAGVVDVGGVLYGAAYENGPSGAGTVFALTLSSGSLTVLHGFGGADGEYPEAAPTLVGGTLYGTTVYGGANGQGAIYAVTLSSQTASVVHSFTGSTPVEGLGLTVLSNTLYAMPSNAGKAGVGEVVRIAPSTGAAKVITEFVQGSGAFVPGGDLTPVAGALVGVADFGGNAGCGGLGCGSVFQINRVTGVQTQVSAFGTGNAANSVGDLLNVGGMLYGTSYISATQPFGSVFKVDPATGTQSVIYSFGGGTDGAYPFAPLLDVGGTLYGTTTQGGANGSGTIFKLNPTTGAETVVYSFGGTGDGALPYSGLIEVGGALYGTTFSGGATGWGTVYRFNSATGKEVILHSFAANGSDGTQPGGNLISLNGLLYGTTVFGGKPGSGCDYNVCGTVFSVNPATGAEAVVHAFAGGVEGGNPPYTNLVAIGGVLYGSTGSAGAHGLGTVFSLKP